MMGYKQDNKYKTQLVAKFFFFFNPDWVHNFLNFSKTERRPLKLVGRRKWGTQDDLRANKGFCRFRNQFPLNSNFELPKGS